jgi:hypothetical protein
VSRRVNYFRQIAPAARVVSIERPDHYVFVLHETDVLREMRGFMSGLQQVMAELVPPILERTNQISPWPATAVLGVWGRTSSAIRA